jgi:uncharacterized membrane protein YhaH (DUF805 family)
MKRNPYSPPQSEVSDAVAASDEPALAPEKLGFFFSARGRLNRKQYWANGILSVLLAPILFGIVSAITRMAWLVPLSIAVIAWSSTVLVARRAHDFGISGWWAGVYSACLVVVPVILKSYGVAGPLTFVAPLFVLFVFGVIPGDLSANRFGLPQGSDPPLENAV